MHDHDTIRVEIFRGIYSLSYPMQLSFLSTVFLPVTYQDTLEICATLCQNR